MLNSQIQKFSESELTNETREVEVAYKFILMEASKVKKVYSKLLNKRRVNPELLVEAKERMETFKRTADFLNQYSKVLADETNRRIKFRKMEELGIIANATKEMAIIEEAVEKLYGPSYVPAIDLGIKNFPNKLQACKDIKDKYGFGIKKSKEFCDYLFDMIKNHNIK